MGGRGVVVKKMMLGGTVFAALGLGGVPALSAHELSATSPLTAPSNPIGYYEQAQRARELMAKDDFKTAEAIYEQLTRDYPLDRTTWIGLGNAKRRLGKCAEAIPAYERSIALIGPAVGQSRYWIASCQLKMGNRDAALDTLEKLVFEDAYLNRPTLPEDPEFAALKDDPRMQKIAGRLPVANLGREAGWAMDIDHLLAEIRRMSPEYQHRPLPARITDAAAALRRDIPRLSDEQVYTRVAQIVGLLNHNHTVFGNMGFFKTPDAVVKDAYLPLRFWAFPEGIFIVDADESLRDLVGAQVMAFDRTPATEALRKVATALSTGSDIEAYWTGPRRLSELHLLAGLGAIENSSEVTLKLKMPTGRQVARTFKAQPEISLSAKLGPPPAVKAPLFLTRVPESHWFEFWPAQSTAYVQVNQIMPDKDESLPEFGLRLRRELAQRSDVKNLILDLRHNNGGNTFTYPELLRTLIAFSAEDGNRLYVLIGRNVYSAAANFSTELERLANPIFVGEPTGNTGNQEGDEGRFRLPYSGVHGSLGGVWWQLASPWDKRRSIAPHVPVQLTAAAYFAGRDPVLDTAQRMISASAKK